jgi:long-chain acyl-CoA synthetase
VYLGAWLAGVELVPLNPAESQREWCDICRRANAQLVLADEQYMAACQAVGIECVQGDQLANPVMDTSGVALADQGSCSEKMVFPPSAGLVLYTSGTTSVSKGVSLSLSAVCANAAAMVAHHELRHERHLAMLPLSHAHALGFGLLSTLLSGSDLFFTDGVPFDFTEIVRQRQITVTSIVPASLPLLDRMAAKLVGSSLRFILVSSAPVDPAAASSVAAKMSIPLLQGWGLSEFSNFATCVRIADVAALSADTNPWFAASLGTPLEGVEVKIVNEDGETVPMGGVGEMWIRGPSMMCGYLDRPDLTNDVLRDGWLRTGDLATAHFTQGLQHFAFYGRIKELIIRGAEKVSPAYVESLIVQYGLCETGTFAVVGFPHDFLGEEIGMVIEGQLLPDADRQLVEGLSNLPDLMRPKIILHVSDIPRTITGKIMRNCMASWFERYRRHSGLPHVGAADFASLER